jgi:predicted nucleic acid-binding protein
VFTALLDTCVLWPSLQRDFLLSLAIEGMYRPIWSSAILEELEVSETAKLTGKVGMNSDEAEHRVRHLIEQMRTAFDDAEVVGWEGLEGTYGLPDPDDEHVLAAAVVGGAGAIVTHNRKDFPRDKMPHGLEVLSPADFALSTVSLKPDLAWQAVRKIVARSGKSGRPVRTTDEILTVLADRYGMADAVDLLQEFS